MPDYEWLCSTCGKSNPPYTEACRECGSASKPASRQAPPLGLTVSGLAGVVLIAYALWDLADKNFCELWCGNILAPLFEFLFVQFGHWGPRVLMIVLGVAMVASSFHLNFKRKIQSNEPTKHAH